MRWDDSTSRRGAWLACALTAFLFAPGVLADISVDWDRGVTFVSYDTFGLAEGTALSNPLAALRLEQAVGAILVAKGLRQDPSPDLLVIIHASVEPSRSLNVGSYKESGGIWETHAPSIGAIDAGTLLVDLLDASTRRLVWRGMATDTITNNPGRNEKPVPKALKKMFRKFPPAPPKQAVAK